MRTSTILFQLFHEATKEILNSLRAIDESAKNFDKQLSVMRNPFFSNAPPIFPSDSPRPDLVLRRYLNIIHQEIAACSELLLELNQFLSATAPKPEKVAVAEIIDDAISSLGIPLPPAVKLVTDFPKLLPPLVVDPDQLRWAISSILRHSIYNLLSGGKLIISARVLNSSLTLTISDTGIGIPAQKQPKIFHPLFLLKTRRIGLGLLIARHLIYANQGKIEQKTHPGIGTSFIIQFPVRSAEAYLGYVAQDGLKSPTYKKMGRRLASF